MGRTRHSNSKKILLLCALLGFANATGSFAAVVQSSKSAATRAELEFQKGLQLAAANRTEAAIQVFFALTQEYPSLEQPHLQLAALYAKQDQLQQAIRSLQAAVKLRTDEAKLQAELRELPLQRDRANNSKDQATHEDH